MRRDSISKKNIISFKGFIFLIIYQILTSLYVYLTPLIGASFCYLVLNKERERNTHIDLTSYRYLVLSYLVFADLNKGFYLFSGVIFFYLFYYIFAEWLQTSFKCKNCVIIAYVASGYFGIFGINNLLAYMLNETFFSFGWEYGVYIISDIVISIVMLKDKML